jgi:uncharacterized protein DUF1833
MPTGNAAWQEAIASVPPEIVLYFTLELQHPGFLEGGVEVPIRIVNGVTTDQIFTIEAGAAFDAGQPATFKAIPFESEFPEFAEGRVPETRIAVDNVLREILPHIQNAMTYRADLKALYREYRSDDTSEPCYGPVEFIVRQLSVTGTRLEGVARLDNLASRKVPSRIYSLQEFPGLQP